MAAAQSVMAPVVLEVPVKRFQHCAEAVQAMADYQTALCENALRRRSNGLTVSDQDHREEVFCLFPPHPDRPPLAIVGGMGPLAGAVAFHKACARFENSRVLVLYQACSVPDRSTVILSEERIRSPLCREVALRLAGAVRLAVDLVPAAREPVRCILACNSAHYFWQLVVDELQRSEKTSCRLQMISLVKSSIDALTLQSCRRVLLLATEGARVGQVFSTRCRDAGIAFDEPSPAMSHLLMSAIFEGIKALDQRRAVELGNEFFETILRSGREYDCILAGCTELPLTIDLLEVRGSPKVSAFLSRIRIVDPLEEALRHV